MKNSILIFLGLLSVGLSAHSAGLTRGCSQDTAIMAAKLDAEANKQVQIGTLSPAGALEADVLALETKYCAGLISLSLACRQIIPDQQHLVESTRRMFALGATTVSNVTDEIRRLGSYETSCKLVK